MRRVAHSGRGRPVIPHELLGTAKVPGHSSELRLLRHDGDFTIWLDRFELMSSRVHESEEALAALALQRLGARPAQRVLVGGLGMGFTLARVLAGVDQEAAVEVVELVPEVVQWNRTLLGHCAGHPLRDPRVRVTVADVRDVLAGCRGDRDVVLLDVDNGPEGLVRPANDRIYDARGLAAARDALRPGGVLAVWSSAESPYFTASLRRTGFAVREHRVLARGHKGPMRMIWVAQRREER